MEWSPQQDQALVEVDRWLKSRDRQVFRLFGFAGTGKTTLARHLASHVDGAVRFGAYTGKAAHVLRQKGCPATTIHQMIYSTHDKSRARLLELERALMALAPDASPAERGKIENEIRREKESLTQPSFRLNQSSDIREASLIVIDECSMVDARMGEDLLWFDVPVLVLGDPAQLPPVGGGGFFTEHEPDIMLTEIHRQAADNPIVAMATEVRSGGRLSIGPYGESRVIHKRGMTSQDALEVDQILVGRNKTRRAYNDRMRALLGYESRHPLAGERLICLRNNHDLGLLNGAMWDVDNVGHVDDTSIVMDIRSEDGETISDVHAHMHYFNGSEEKLMWWERKEAEEFDYGYAVTTHKAQGSQWGDVMVFDESWVFRNDRNRWLYTAITRAAERLTVVVD